MATVSNKQLTKLTSIMIGDLLNDLRYTIKIKATKILKNSLATTKKPIEKTDLISISQKELECAIWDNLLFSVEMNSPQYWKKPLKLCKGLDSYKEKKEK